MQFDPNHLAALSAVLRFGSFETAAAQLCVTPSAVSQRIKALEDRVGASLIRRGAPCTGTQMGERLMKHAEDVGLLEAQLARDLSLKQDTAPARLRIAVNADSLATWLLPALAATPDMLFDLVIDDQDHSADWLKRGEVSAAITASDVTAPGCDRVELGALTYIATANPTYMARWFPTGVTRAALSKAPMLTFDAKDMLQKRWLASNFGPQLAPPSHFLPSSQGFVDAALSGLGWGMNPRTLVDPFIAKGQLVPLLQGTELTTPLCWQVSRVMAPALSGLTRAIKTAARKTLKQIPDA